MMSPGLIIFLIFILGGFAIVSLQDKKEEGIRTKENLYIRDKFNYCGGNDYVAIDTEVELKWGKDNVLIITFVDAGRVEYIVYSNIMKVSGKTEHQILQEIDTTIIGGYGFSKSHNYQNNEHYLCISYKNQEDVEQTLILSHYQKHMIQSRLNVYNDILKAYAENKTINIIF